MGPEKREKERRVPEFDPNTSWIERVTGQYTDIAIVGVLFTLVLIVLFIIMIIYEKHVQMILTGLLTAFGSFGGFLAGKKRKKK